jgi:geranylgeranyl pyrophosphate synthase
MLTISAEEIESLHIGQGYDLYWTRHASCPTQEEYLEMVSRSTLEPPALGSETKN